jgi:hypothetical protein
MGADHLPLGFGVLKYGFLLPYYISCHSSVASA